MYKIGTSRINQLVGIILGNTNFLTYLDINLVSLYHDKLKWKILADSET